MHAELDRFYSLLGRLRSVPLQGGALSGYTEQSRWPARGVYFFQEPRTRRSCVGAAALQGATAFEVGVQEVAVEPSSDRFKSKRQHLHVYEKQADGEWKIAAAMSGNQ